MTNEEIKEEAELYAWKKIKRKSDKQFTQALVEAYLEGAHSRDEEIKDLRQKVEEYETRTTKED